MAICYKRHRKVIQTGSLNASIASAKSLQSPKYQLKRLRNNQINKKIFFFLKENIRAHPHYHGLSKDFLNRTQKEPIRKGGKWKNMTTLNLRTCVYQDNNKRWNVQPLVKEGICFLYICIDHVHVHPSVGSYPEYTDEELLQINKGRYINI